MILQQTYFPARVILILAPLLLRLNIFAMLQSLRCDTHKQTTPHMYVKRGLPIGSFPCCRGSHSTCGGGPPTLLPIPPAMNRHNHADIVATYMKSYFEYRLSITTRHSAPAPAPAPGELTPTLLNACHHAVDICVKAFLRPSMLIRNLTGHILC